MPATFPNSPTPGQTYSTSGVTWTWTGTLWNLVINTGSSGTSGVLGSSGASSSRGSSGTVGSSGSSGTVGSSGSSGTGGSSGTAGSAGTTGTSNTSGSSGTSGALLSIATVENNRILTSDGSTGAVAEANLTFDGSLLKVVGSAIVSQSVATRRAVTIIGNLTANLSSSILGPSDFWATGGTMIIARQSLAGAGTQNTGLAIGGDDPTYKASEEYNGASWTAGGTLIHVRIASAGAGTQNAGLAFGGYCGGSPFDNPNTEEYDGTSWTAGGALIRGRSNLAGAGTQNQALAFGGVSQTPFAPELSCTEEYNGTSWTAGGALITARNRLAGVGTQNSGLAIGGNVFPVGALTCTEEYDGTSWTAGGVLITAISNTAGTGTQNAALAIGNPFFSQKYNGTSWTSAARLIILRDSFAGAGTQNDAIAFGGFVPAPGPGASTCTEQYTGTPNTADIFTTCSNEVRLQCNLTLLSLISTLNFANDTAAAAGGVPLAGLYRSGSFVLIRLT